MDDRRNTIPAEQHQSQEPRLEHEGHRSFKAEHRPKEITHKLRQRSPVCAELKLHRQPGGHTDAEIQHIQLRPEAGLAVIKGIAGA